LYVLKQVELQKKCYYLKVYNYDECLTNLYEKAIKSVLTLQKLIKLLFVPMLLISGRAEFCLKVPRPWLLVLLIRTA
jgi:hypothetical protein